LVMGDEKGGPGARRKGKSRSFRKKPRLAWDVPSLERKDTPNVNPAVLKGTRLRCLSGKTP